MPLVGLMLFFRYEPPLLAVERGKVCVARDWGVNNRQVEPIGTRKGEGIDLFAPGDEDLVIVVPGQRQGRLQAARHLHLGMQVVRPAGDDDRSPLWEGFADRLEGLSAHDDRVAGGAQAEMLEILG